MSDPWFRILVSSGGSKGGHGGHEGPLGAYRFESHPLVVSIPQATLNKFIEFDENVEVYIILALWLAKEGGKRVYRPGSRELLVHALSDTGIGVEPLVDPRIASLPLPEQDKSNANVIVVSPLFAQLHGLEHGDLCHVRRIKHTSVLLDQASLLALQPVDEYDQKELVDCLLSKAHIVAQGGLVLVSFPKSSSSHVQNIAHNTIANGATQPNGTSEKSSREVTSKSKTAAGDDDLLSKHYLGFIVLDTGQVCQGVLTRKTTIYVVPSHSRPSSQHSGSLQSHPTSTALTSSQYPHTSSETRLHELYYSALANGTLSASVAALLSSQPLPSRDLSQSLLSSSTSSPSKPLMRSSMLVVPYGGGGFSPSGSYLSGVLRTPSFTSSLSTSSHTTPGKTQLKSPGTRGATPGSASLSPSSFASPVGNQQVSVINRSFLRVSVLKEPLVKLTAKTKAAIVKTQQNSETAPSQTLDPLEGDVTLEVGVSLETMKQQMVGVFNGSWVEVSVASNQGSADEVEVKRQLARLYVLDSGADYTLYVPPNMAFNLGLDTNVTTQLVKLTPVPQVEQFLKEANKANAASSLIGAAHEIHFALVANPSNPHYEVSSKALIKYFSRPRILRENQVFSIVVTQPRWLDLVEQPNMDFENSDDEDDDTSIHSDADESTSQTTDSTNAPSDKADDSLYQLVHFKITRIKFSPLSTSNPASDVSAAHGDSAASKLPYFAYVPAKPVALSDGTVHSRVPVELDHFLLHSHRPSFAPALSASAILQKSHPGAQSVIISNPTTSNPSISLNPERAPAGLQPQFEELMSILRPCLHPMSSSFGLYVAVLLHGARGAGKTKIVRSLAARLGVAIVEINCFDLIGHTDVETERYMTECFERAKAVAPSILVLSEFSAFDDTKSENMEPTIANALKEKILSLPSIHQQIGHPVMLIATCINATEISRNLRAVFRVEVQIPSPDESNRFAVLQGVLDACANAHAIHRSVNFRDLALRTASFQRRNLAALVSKASECAIKRVLDFQVERLKKAKKKLSAASAALLERDLACSGIVITSEDFDNALHVLQSAHSSSLGTPKIPQVKWEDVGGLYEAKREILDTIQLPLQHPELFTKGMSQRSGILLYGPPGTGKTLLAKAVATECALNFISVKGPELINMYIGESEKNVREVFQRARDARPCVIFFDELDSLAPNRGRSGDSGGVMDRIVSQLLAELSGMSQKTGVFVIGATNRPDLIDPALLVPGRFDKMIFLGVNAEVSQKHNVLKALTRKFNLGPSVDLMALAEMCPQNLTGADLYALGSDAMSLAIKAQIDSLRSLSQDKLDQLKKDETDMPVTVEQEHFVAALNALTPSVSMAELERYKDMADKLQKKT